LIGDGLPVGPPCRRHASAEVDEILFRNVDADGADFRMGRGGLGRGQGHGGLLTLTFLITPRESLLD